MQIEKQISLFGGFVKAARQARGMTQIKLAEILHITPRYLKAIENSGRKPSYNLLVRIVRELDIPTDTIFYSELENEEPVAKILPFDRQYRPRRASSGAYRGMRGCNGAYSKGHSRKR